MSSEPTIKPGVAPTRRRTGVVAGAIAPALVRRLARRAARPIDIVDGGVRVRFGPEVGPAVTVEIRDRRAYGALLRHNTAGFGDAYIAGWFECDDLTALIRTIIASTRGIFSSLDDLARRLAPLLDPIARRKRTPKDVDRSNVRAHYDLSNAFFELMLDETMAYSCAIFDRPTSTLADGSIAKIDRLLDRLEIGPGDSLLEIGTGWGGLSLRAAQRGARVTTTTISAEQREYSIERMAKAGVSDSVTVLDLDYRDLTGTYDKVVSVEMIEAVGWKEFATFFSTCASLLAPTGAMAIQAITINDRSFDRAKYREDLIKALVFPGGCIPSVASMVDACTSATDLRLVALDDIGLHYAETLRRWRANVAAHRAEIAELGFDDSFVRLWNLYLAYCEAAFEERHISDVQMLLAKPGWRPNLALPTVVRPT